MVTAVELQAVKLTQQCPPDHAYWSCDKRRFAPVLEAAFGLLMTAFDQMRLEDTDVASNFYPA